MSNWEKVLAMTSSGYRASPNLISQLGKEVGSNSRVCRRGTTRSRRASEVAFTRVVDAVPPSFLLRSSRNTQASKAISIIWLIYID